MLEGEQTYKMSIDRQNKQQKDERGQIKTK